MNFIALGGIIFIIVLSFFFINSDNGSKADDTSKGFTSEPVVHGSISYELIGSDYEGTLHTFHFKVKNVGDGPATLSSIFNIINGEKRFSSNDMTYSTDKLNPGMEGTIDVVFEMNLEDLTTGQPKIEIDRGLIFKDIIEIDLKNKVTH